MEPTKVKMYTDGSYLPVSKNGGAAAVILPYGVPPKWRIIKHKGYSGTTSMRMEMQALILGLEWLKEPSIIQLFTDCAGLVKGLKEKPRAGSVNNDLWNQIYMHIEGGNHSLRVIKVKSHSKCDLHNLADHMAGLAACEG